MKKTLLALAISAFTANAVAAVDLTDRDTAVTFASELVVPATGGRDIANASDVLTAEHELGLTIVNEKKFYARYELTGATFADSTAANLTASADAGTTYQLSENNFVIFEVENLVSDGTANAGADTVLSLDPGTINLTAKGTVGVRYTLHETLTNAVENTGALKTVSGTLATFAPALTASFSTVPASSAIDVSENSAEFETGVATAFGSFEIAADTDYYGVNAANDEIEAIAAVDQLLEASNVLTVAGDFSAALKDGEDLDVDAVKFGATSADELTATLASFELAANDVVDGTFTYTVDGETAINEGSYTATLTFDAAEGYAIPAVTGTIATLEKNGASQDIDITMKPGGFYNNVIRITNKSAITGDVFITVINDDGERATVNLGDIAGQESNSLNAGASTNQIAINDIYAAATGLALPRDGKLRLIVEAQVPVNGLSVQSLVVSSDGTTLSRFE
ncbi:hypothetical protein [Stutzerimonas nitrititolerans]|uniref:hypothetical protein n=1 Tax=Stutzerimonas nitrititolerans TaxID=2482751 RepID=UPI00289D87B3|nr:hypothetical protein [Stutzerimonas nitrititolerans]